jgi:hypothetical protein
MNIRPIGDGARGGQKGNSLTPWMKQSNAMEREQVKDIPNRRELC